MTNSAAVGMPFVLLVDVVCSGEREGQHEEDAASGTAVMMSTYATANGDVGVAYANTAFRNLGLLEFQLADLEGVVVQVIVFQDSIAFAGDREICTCSSPSTLAVLCFSEGGSASKILTSRRLD